MVMLKSFYDCFGIYTVMVSEAPADSHPNILHAQTDFIPLWNFR